MPRVEIRDLSGDEALEAMYPLTAYAFGATPPLRDKAEFITTGRLRPAGHSTVAFEDGRPAAVVSALPMTQNVRGGLFGASAILGVASDPATRRQGYVRDAMAAMLRATRDDRQPFSALYPFRESFYERMGYVSISRGHLLKVSPANLTPLLKRELGGRVERLSIADGYDLARAYALGVRQRTHGMAVFDRPEKEHALHHNDYWIALAYHGREVIGAMPYSIRHEPGTGNVLKGPRFLYDTSQARYLLLQWIARHADQVAQAEIRVAAFERPDTWLTDARSSVEFSGAPMVRVVDVGAIGDMRTDGGTTAGGGQFVAHISDPLCPWNEGAWRFATEGGRLRVSRVEDTGGGAVVELTIQGLTALVFGSHDPADFVYRGWGAASPAALTAMRTLFPAALPYLFETF